MRSCEVCPASIDHLRRNARYCSSTCRARAAERRSADLPVNLDPDSFWSGYARHNRSRPLVREV